MNNIKTNNQMSHSKCSSFIINAVINAAGSQIRFPLLTKEGVRGWLVTVFGIITILLLLSSAAHAVTQQQTLPFGWSLVSVPLTPSDPSPSVVFDEVAPLHIYDYAGGQNLSLQDAGFRPITPGRAQWLLLAGQTVVKVDGSVVDGQNAYRVPLQPGWNTVATPWITAVKWNDTGVSVARGFSTLPLSQAIASAWIEGDLRSYQSPSGPYTTISANTTPAGTLGAWKGYLLFANVACELIFSPPPHNNNPPHVDIRTPGEGSSVAVLSDIIGTAEDDDLLEWKLEYAPAETKRYSTLALDNAPVTDGLLSHLDPTLLMNGMALLRLSATDALGNTSEIERTVLIDGDNKLGDFRITFVDLDVPVSGIPITIRRSYDSRTRGVADDFGYGWTLEAIAPGRYVNNRKPGDGWIFTSGALNIPCSGTQETKSHITEIRFSDREFYRFAFIALPQSPVTGGCFINGSFVQVGGIPGATLTDLTGSMVNRLFWDANTDYIIDNETTDTYEPVNVRLTTLEGTQFDVNLQTGLYRITDLDDNSVTITASGVTHSSGKSIGFTRDGAGRIIAITDPEGKIINYSYDGAGNLIAATNRTGETITFGYNTDHFLTTIIDPLGNTPITAQYDAEGRVIGLVDADGNPSTLSHNVVANTSQATDRLGNSTQYQYGTDGFLAEVAQLGNTITSYTYNSRGRVLTETDPLGHVTSNIYDSKDNLLTRTDPLGNVMSYTYGPRREVLTTTDARGKVTTNEYYPGKRKLKSTTDPLGKVTSYTYDSHGNLASQTDAMACTTTYVSNAHGYVLSKTDALGNSTESTYDANGNTLTETVHRTVNGLVVAETTTNTYYSSGRLLTRTDALSHTITTVYDSAGRQQKQLDARNNETKFEYDKRGNMKKKIFADGTFEVYGYDREGRKTATTNRNGHSSFTEYDDLGRLTKSIHPDATFAKNEYDGAGRLVKMTDERGYSTQYEYDNAGRRTAVIDALGHRTEFTYDANGNQKTAKDAANHITTNEYDDANRLVKVTFHDGTFKTTNYDALGRKTSEVDPAGKITAFEYDCLGRLTKVTNPLGHETKYGYDEIGNEIRQTDANNHTTRFEYDANGQRTKRILPLGQYETMDYDPAGNLLTHADFNGAATSFVYDSENRLVRKDYSDHTFVSFSYTANGQRNTVTDFRGVTSYNYDIRDRLNQVTHPNGAAISYAYDATGNRSSLTIPSGTTGYTFDRLNRLKTVSDSDGGISTYSYDDTGNRATVTYPNGTFASYTYDDLNRLTNIANKKSDNSVISSYGYTLGTAGNRTQVIEQDSRTVGYSYDELYRLTAENIVDPAHGNRNISYVYDNVGNRLTKTDTSGASTATTSYIYDDNDRLLSEGTIDSSTGSSSTSYGYDNNGSTISKTESTGTTNYGYDYENRLVRVDAPDKTIEYQYDADGNRVQSKVDAVVTDFVVDTNRDYAQVLEERDGSGSLIVKYTSGDDLISQNRGGSISYYHYDGQMSTRQLTNGIETITDTYEFDAFGNTLQSTGSSLINYLYTSEQFDRNGGYYYLRARYYNQDLGRFRTMDALDGEPFEPNSLHRYIYTQGDPVNGRDRSGLFSEFDIAITSMYEDFLRVSEPVAAGARGIAAAKRVGDAALAAAIAVCAAQGLLSGLTSAGSGGPCDFTNKNIFYSGLDMPKTTDHIRDAQLLGYTPILHYIRPGKDRSWTSSTSPCQGNNPGITGLWCDEYPFASTHEGGPGSHLSLVPAAEQQRQGGFLRVFYQACHIIPNSLVTSEFLVIPTADPISSWVCK